MSALAERDDDGGHQQHPQRRPLAPFPEQNGSGDRRHERRVVDGEAEPRHPRLAPLALVEVHHVEGPEEAPRPSDARRGHHRRPAHVIARVVDRPAAVHLRDLALVTRWRRQVDATSGHVERRQTGTGAVVDGIAVRTRERETVVRREEHGLVEAAHVVDDPRCDDEHARADRGADARPVCARSPRDGKGEQRDEQQQFGTRERGQSAHRAQRRAPAHGRAVERGERRQQRADDGEVGDGLGHHEPVVHPDVRAHRGDAGRDQSDRVAAGPAAQETDEHDDSRAEQHHRVAVLTHVGVEVVARDPRQRGSFHQPRDRCEHEDRERRVIRGRRRVLPRMAHVPQGLDEPVARREPVGGRVVEELVPHRALARVGAVDVGHVDRARLALRERDVRDAHTERDDGDDEQQSPEFHGTSAPVNASTEAATRPAAASTSTVRSRPSVSRTSASAST